MASPAAVERVVTAPVGTTANQVINQRMYKERQMRRTRAGGQSQLYPGTAMISGESGRYARVADAKQ